VSSSTTSPIKIGVITDMTGPLSFLGTANANIAKMVIDDINADGRLLGRPLSMHLEDSATTDSVAEAKSRKLVLEDKADVLLGAEQYEGQECHPLIFCTGQFRRKKWSP